MWGGAHQGSCEGTPLLPGQWAKLFNQHSVLSFSFLRFMTKLYTLGGFEYISGLIPFECQEFTVSQLGFNMSYYIEHQAFIWVSLTFPMGAEILSYIFLSLSQYLFQSKACRKFSVRTYWVKNLLYDNTLSILHHNMRVMGTKISVVDLKPDFVSPVGHDLEVRQRRI